VVLLGVGMRAQMTPWLQWTLLPQNQMAEIVGEASGENAYHMIMETAGYDKDRKPEEFGDGLFYETKFYFDKIKNEYGFDNAQIVKFPGGQSWDASKGELWEVTPIRQKLASYRDMAAMLATGSVTGETSGELVWIGAGRADDLKGKDIAGKIVVTEGSAGSAHMLACIQGDAVGVISIQGTRPFFDPLQVGWASVGSFGRGGPAGAANAPAAPAKPSRFAFQIPPREGEYLKRRLLAGQKITVRSQVAAQMRAATMQNIVWSIPGTDPAAGEIIFSAHLYEGYIKQGTDDISGCATLVEVARTLKTLIDEGRLPKPKRTIRFIIGPEYSGTSAWVNANKDVMARTFCNINMDMVGEWLSLNKSFMCLMRTTYGNPHYVNDVVENYYRYVGDGNRERIQNRSNFYPVPVRIVAPTGADEPFYYSIETHYGASDHEVFNDWGVQVPGVMMIAWPDQWYHTSGDHVDKADPTQLKRVAIIGAASAYTIASADDDVAIKIAGEISSNGTARLGHQLVRGLEALNGATAATLEEAYKSARGYVEASAINEKDTLDSVLQLTSDKKRVADYVATVQKSVDQVAASAMATLETHMKATATRLKATPITLKLTELEVKASKVVPKQTPKVKEGGYNGYRQAMNAVPADVRDKLLGAPPAAAAGGGRAGFGPALDTVELGRLVNGRHTALDIKKMLDAQGERKADLQQVLNYLDYLKAAGLVEIPQPVVPKKKTN
ncbi:MAG: M28 family peptidase, partial [Bacteroidales bacterium]